MSYIEQKLGYQPLLLLDDGHGGNGATAGKRTPKFSDGTVIYENQFNEAVINLMEKDAKRLGFKTLLLAPTQEDIPLSDRTAKANETIKAYKKELEAKGIKTTDKQIAILYSQHYNAHLGTWDSKAEGVSTHYHPDKLQSKRLAECVHKYIKQGTPQKDRGIVASNFHMLRVPLCPSILSEAGFMDNEREARLMLDVNFQRETAKQAIQGICEYFGCEYVEEIINQTTDELKEAIEFLSSKSGIDTVNWYTQAKSGKIQWLDSCFIKIANAWKADLK